MPTKKDVINAELLLLERKIGKPLRDFAGNTHVITNNINEVTEIVGSNLCGFNPRTEAYYKNKTTYERLWNYNGTANSNYPAEILKIMNDF